MNREGHWCLEKGKTKQSKKTTGAEPWRTRIFFTPNGNGPASRNLAATKGERRRLVIEKTHFVKCFAPSIGQNNPDKCWDRETQRERETLTLILYCFRQRERERDFDTDSLSLQTKRERDFDTDSLLLQTKSITVWWKSPTDTLNKCFNRINKKKKKEGGERERANTCVMPVSHFNNAFTYFSISLWRTAFFSERQ